MATGKTSDVLSKLGDNIKALRTKKKLSLRQLAAQCDVDHSDIAKIEKGERNFTILTLLELAKGLEVHPRKLLDFDIE